LLQRQANLSRAEHGAKKEPGERTKACSGAGRDFWPRGNGSCPGGGVAGIAPNRDPIPDATPVRYFRHWLESHDLPQGRFEEAEAVPEARRSRHG